MRGRLPVSLGIGVLLVLVVAPSTDRTAHTVNACWDISPYPMFLSTRAPEDRRYYSGTLGILHPSYYRADLVVAWRTLAGRPLLDAERQAYLPAPPAMDHVSALEQWSRERQALPGFSARSYFSQETWIEPTYSYILNCGDSALLTATRTLQARRASLGASAPEFLAWVAAQDMVFSNCSRRPGQPPAIPEPLGPTESPRARADRAYQIAAAQLYAGQFAEAETAFAKIAQDSASPWQRTGIYLSARAMIRQATMGGESASGDPAAAARAREALRATIADPAQAEMHNSAEGLLQYLDVRADPSGALDRAATALAAPEANGDIFARRLTDFRLLMDHYWNGREPGGVDALALVRRSNELIDWLVTLQVAGDEALEHAIARWDATRSQAWLVVALMKLGPGHARQDDLLSDAAAVTESSPAYLTLAFNRARLLLLSGDAAGARAVLGRALASPALTVSAANQLRAARLVTARTLDEFLQDAVRTPILEQGTGDATFDADSIDVLNEQIPLGLLQQIANHQTLPALTRFDMRRAIFTRAVLLQNAEVVRRSIGPLSRAHPELAGSLGPLRAAPSDQGLMDEARLLLLAHPGLHPFLSAGSYRRTAFNGSGQPLALGLTAIDGFRDNWWCSFEPKPNSGVWYETRFNGRAYARQDPVMAAFRLHPNEPDRLAFLSDAQRRQAADEWTALQKIDTGPNELGRWATKWVEDHPSDPRAPKVLYQVVRATRYGCTDAQTGAISHRAFALLHSRYPGSEWAKKTPFWFN